MTDTGVKGVREGERVIEKGRARARTRVSRVLQ